MPCRISPLQQYRPTSFFGKKGQNKYRQRSAAGIVKKIRCENDTLLIIKLFIEDIVIVACIISLNKGLCAILKKVVNLLHYGFFAVVFHCD